MYTLGYMPDPILFITKTKVFVCVGECEPFNASNTVTLSNGEEPTTSSTKNASPAGIRTLPSRCVVTSTAASKFTMTCARGAL